ncbi:MAG TPA: hypothetical protein DDZ51_17490 [Planctomycetaceae bacterium]|nr:hypothetical protein [Planctomycetaceae bacterium]
MNYTPAPPLTPNANQVFFWFCFVLGHGLSRRCVGLSATNDCVHPVPGFEFLCKVDWPPELGVQRFVLLLFWGSMVDVDYGIV